MDHQGQVRLVVFPHCTVGGVTSLFRITSKTDVKTWNKSSGSGKLFSMDLMDDTG